MQEIVIKVKHGGATHELSLHPTRDCPYDKIATLLHLPGNRLKIIRQGRLLPPKGDRALSEALTAGGVYLVSGTARDAQLPSNTRRRVRQAAAALSQLRLMITWAGVYAWLLWLWLALASAPGVAFQFITSMVVPPARPPTQRQRQRAVQDHAD